MKGKIALVIFALIATLFSSPQAFSINKTNKTTVVIKNAGRTSTSIPNTILSGNGIPAKTIGIDGDFYIDLKNAILYGPKTKGLWKFALSLRIPALPAINGSDGAKGNTGEQGATGSIGNTGAIGAAGSSGAVGAQGEVGVAGNPGAAGSKGDTGNVGATGATGETGITGAKGDVGSIGSSGSTGARGETGLTGQTGLQGNPGTNGTNGAVGSTGAVGAAGSTGNSGSSGSPGARGETGLTGQTGLQGSPGTNGSNGAVGAAGAAGAAGADGTNGSNGAVGAAGADGANGSKGDTGLAGADGTNGSKGDTGNQGAAGISIAYWVSIPMITFLTNEDSHFQDSEIFFSMSQNSNYTFEILIGGLLPLTSTEDFKINAVIICSTGCSTLQQFAVISNEISNANNMPNKQYGIRILGVVANGAESPDLRIRLSIKTATTIVTSVMFSGKGIVNKVGSLG